MPHYRCAIALALCSIAVLAGKASSQTAEDKGNLDKYLNDVTAGAVSAGNLVGLSQSAITQIQTSQDLVVALKPLSSGSSKSGFGLAVTPGRTTITPIAATDYNRFWYWRLLGSITGSYAENTSDASGTSYRKSALSLDGFYYVDRDQDPVILAQDAFGNCPEKRMIELADAKARVDKGAALRELKEAAAAARKGEEGAEERLRQAQKKLDALDAIIEKAPQESEGAVKKCIDDAKAKKARWNAHRIALSMGAGWIKPDDNSSSRESLGRSVTLGAIIKTLEDGATYVSLRRTTREVDIATLKTTPAYKSSNLAAVRYTYGSHDDNGDLKALVEVSNAKSNDVTASNSVFKYAVGIDKKIGKGTWLEFRLGKNRTFDGTTTQMTGLLTINFAPTAGLFSK